jgi:superfamily II RNA helicase
MVKICSSEYPLENEALYEMHFQLFSFPLSSFQKFAIEGTVEGHHVLVTAHTGSGKTLPAEFAIQYFVGKGKKVIYTAPIKALSNQKFYEFSAKFPEISFGILTGDIKTNPEADVLIMTTEILLNTLYAKKENTNKNSLLSFDMDFENDLACVIFDEIHYINDAERGRVWEETIMLMPLHIQMVMLSATLDSPENFAAWCESHQTEKEVYLATTYQRVVPLTHYSFITCTQGLFKTLKDKKLEMEIMKQTNKLHIIQDAKGTFAELNYYMLQKTLNLMKQKNHFVKRQHVLNSVSKHMVQNNMLPAICFVLNRKTLEDCAKEITTNLLEDDSKVPYIINRECEQIIRKLPNYQEYLQLPEYHQMVALLEKGIAIHHAGVMPVLREMVELLFAKGYIKLLFATETFAVGINMPTKTVLFTNLLKFDGNNMRPLLGHEYTQMAGRAGRRGIDTLGYVIHLTNLFGSEIDLLTLKTMMKGKPQLLQSKFKISYNLMLNFQHVEDMLEHCLFSQEIKTQNRFEESRLHNLSAEASEYREKLKNPFDKIEEFVNAKERIRSSVNKTKKELDKKLLELTKEYPTISEDVSNFVKYQDKIMEYEKTKEALHHNNAFLQTKKENVIYLLQQYGMINESMNLTQKGEIASQIREIHCLVFAELLLSHSFDNSSAEDLVSIFSCFTNITVPEEKKQLIIPDSDVTNHLKQIKEMYDTYQKNECYLQVDTGFNYDNFHFDLLQFMPQWCNTSNYQETKWILQEIALHKEIFLGEFVKAVLKINTIASELENIAQQINDLSLLQKLREIPRLTMKHVVTNQSLYI